MVRFCITITAYLIRKLRYPANTLNASYSNRLRYALFACSCRLCDCHIFGRYIFLLTFHLSFDWQKSVYKSHEKWFLFLMKKNIHFNKIKLFRMKERSKYNSMTGSCVAHWFSKIHNWKVPIFNGYFIDHCNAVMVFMEKMESNNEGKDVQTFKYNQKRFQKICSCPIAHAQHVYRFNS